MRYFQIASFSLLLVLVTGCVGEEPLPEELESVGESQAAIRGTNINNSYWAAFGRDPTQFELNYWNGLRDFSTSDVMRWHGDWLANDYLESWYTIDRSYRVVFGQSPDSAQLKYWQQDVINNHRLFQDIVYWLRDYAKKHGMHATGTWCGTVWDGSAFRQQCGPSYIVDPASTW